MAFQSSVILYSFLSSIHLFFAELMIASNGRRTLEIEPSGKRSGRTEEEVYGHVEEGHEGSRKDQRTTQ